MVGAPGLFVSANKLLKIHVWDLIYWERMGERWQTTVLSILKSKLKASKDRAEIDCEMRENINI